MMLLELKFQCQQQQKKFGKLVKKIRKQTLKRLKGEIMKTFNYHSAKDVKEASKLSSSSSAYLAGGMTTIPSMKLGLATYKDIIDIKKIKKLSGIKVSGKAVIIGATTKHVEVANSKDVKKAIPSLAALAEGIGDPQVRNRGTIGGSIANNDPAADYPSACIALNATIHTNNRKIKAESFFKGMFETSLKKREIIEAIEFKIPQKSSYQKLPNPASRYAIVGVYVAKYKNGINVAVTGAKSSVYNDKSLASALSKSFSSSAIETVRVSSSDMNADIHASADYRANMVKTFAKKAVDAC
jgi:carbon-monoxide dehydrogenase medium subunit